MKLDTRRLWVGRFLLMVYFSILSVSVFHVHKHEGENFMCQDCINHVRHSGHITEDGSPHGDCVLCSFLFTSYLVAEVIALATIVYVFRCNFVEKTVCVVYQIKHIILLRGPPVCL